ncbi:hypothetical protein TNCV_2226801 [Trichonephila clavipes]|uniref:Uncharacterized protein n=1 Tax=Trichonephila clavipes TaxID=2585209 RepID=A0A8X6WEK6_TRICX|nr:hypothetical protein TNCV_2226801 [Trichonephila clavipes]
MGWDPLEVDLTRKGKSFVYLEDDASPGDGSGKASIGFLVGGRKRKQHTFRGSTGMRYSQPYDQVVLHRKEAA